MFVFALFIFQMILFTIGFIAPWRKTAQVRANGHLPRLIRLLLSFSLVVAAFVIWQSGARQATYAQFVAFGMLASFIGDVLLSELLHLPNRLIWGMLAFGVAHILYIVAFAQTILIDRLDLNNFGFEIGVGFYLVVATLGWLMLIRNPQKDLATNIGSLIYGMLVATMASLGLGLASGGWRFGGLTAIGGFFFVVSDFIIGIVDIRGIKIKNASDVIWLTYVLAQAGIIYASAI